MMQCICTLAVHFDTYRIMKEFLGGMVMEPLWERASFIRKEYNSINYLGGKK